MVRRAPRFRSLLGIVCLTVWLPAAAAAGEPTPHWIWPTTRNGQRAAAAYLRTSFDVKSRPLTAELRAIADFHEMTLYLNGKPVGLVEDFSPPQTLDVLQRLREGKNVLAVRGRNPSGPAAVCIELTLTFADKTRQVVCSDASWLASEQADRGWEQPSFAADGWKHPADFGRLAAEPWGTRGEDFGITPLDDYTQWKQALGTEQSADPAAFQVPAGFQIELLRSAQPEEDSWISMTFDRQGRLLVGMESQGILRMTLPQKDGGPVQVEKINDSLKEVRGLLVAHGALYVSANESQALFRLRDSVGDDRFDEVRKLRDMPGGRGHGRNDLALGRDGKIYLIHGDSVDVPTEIRHLTSPFREQSRGQKTRQGFVLRTDAEGRSWELVTSGLRNPYGIAFHPDGGMFTYDADAEYDTGAPWYRPTRVQHLLPGGDYGWRGVTRNWPPFYPDKPDAAPPTLDIGKGSPTSLKFGTDSNYPPKYQRALFALDWAYGRIIAVHFTPRGASYAGQAETFLKGRPLNVTDLAFGPDGAMYVVTGGRKTKSGLYRVRYVGPKVHARQPTAQQQARTDHAQHARKLRRELESYLAAPPNEEIVSAVWPHLGSADPALRHAARIALEHQLVASWQHKALTESRPLAALTALLSLAQGGGAEVLPKVVVRTSALPLAELAPSRQWIALRVYELCLDRMKQVSPEFRDAILAAVDPLYPAADFRVNLELSELLVRLKAKNVVPRTMQLLAAATEQREQMQYLYVLRNVKQGWSLIERENYFKQLADMESYVGGEGMPTFIKQIRGEALAALTPDERGHLEPILTSANRPVETPAEALNRPFVRDWQLADLRSALDEVGRGRNFERGKTMFAAAMCIRCHRMRTAGAAVGPDLTSLAGRFSRKDMLESILSPSKVVSEKYRNDMIITADGRVIVGRIMQGGDYRKAELRIVTNPLEPDKVTVLSKSDVEEHATSPVSLMPKGLLNTLTQEEILDLLAYLESGGNPNHTSFAAAGK